MKKRIISMLLAIVMVVGLLPAVSVPASAADAVGYIANIGIVAADTAEDAKQQLTNTGHTVIDRDLNEGAGGKRIYMGYTRTMDAGEAIYGLQIFYGQAADRDSYNGFHVIGTGGEPNTANGGKVNLNAGTAGDELYLAVTRDSAYSSQPLVDIQITDSDIPPDSYYIVECTGGVAAVHLNLNVTGGREIHMHQQRVQPVLVRLQLYYLSDSGSMSYAAKGRTVYLYRDTFTWDEQPRTVTYGGQVYQFAAWRENLKPGPVTANTATATYENPERTYHAVYSRDVKLSFDANGGADGPAAQTETEYLYAKAVAAETESKTFTIPTEEPTHAENGKEFYGWSASADGTGNTYFPGDTITLTEDTTLYAVWTVSAADCTVTLDEDSYLETGAELKPAVTVKHGETVLTNGTDYSVQYTNNISPGTAKVMVTLKAPYEGTLVTWFHIKDITFRTEPSWISPPSDGQSKTVTLKAAVDGEEVSGASYELEGNYSGVTIEGSTLTVSSDCNDGYIQITGSYESFRENFSILVQRQDIPSFTLSSTITTYNGMEQKPVIVGFIDGSDLTEGKDYTVTYLRKGEATTDLTSVGDNIVVLLTGINDYTGTRENYYSIQSADISDVAKSGHTEVVDYNGQPQKPEFTLFIEETGYVLREGTDYTVSYRRGDAETTDFTSIGGITIRVTGQGNFTGEDVLPYTIQPNNITDDIYIPAEDVTYDGEDHKPTVSVLQGGKPLTENTDYTVSYQRDGVDTDDFKNAGTVTVTVTGMGNCTGSKTVSYTIFPKALTDSDVTVSEDTVWNGSEQKPAVTVSGVPESDYTVTYTRDGEETTDFTGCGTITITVEGANSNCTGTVTKDYVIDHAADMICCEASYALKYQADEDSEIVYTNDLSYLKESGTVTLLKGITLSDHITVDNLKLVMNGQSVTIASNKQISVIAENGSLTVDASAGGSFASTSQTYFHALINVSSGTLTVIGNPVFDGLAGIQSSSEIPIDLLQYTGEGLLIYSYRGNDTPVTPTLGSGYQIISWTQNSGDGSDLADNAIPFMQTGKVVKTHVHVWNYTASGNTIKATCQADGCPETGAKTIVISASDKVYDGTAVTAAVTNTVDSTDYSASIVYEAKTGALTEGKAVNVGTYTAKITVDGVTASVDFEITPITYTVTATDDGNGTASASPASGAEGAEVTLTATPNDGYQFKEWLVISGGVTVTDDKFTIGTEDVVIEAVFEQVPAPSLNSVSILAVDEAGNPLFGAEMQLLDAENMVVEVWTSTEEVHTIEGLRTNVTYTLHVTEAPDGYIVPIAPGDTVYAQFSIDVDGNVSYSNEVAEDGVLLVMLEEPSLCVGGVEMKDGDYLASGADSVSDIAPASGGYAHYSGGVLTLHDYAYEGAGYRYDQQQSDYYHALVYAKALELEIVLEGSSSLAFVSPDAVSDDESCIISGIYAEFSDVTVSGAGSLSIAAEYVGMDFPYSTLAVSGGSVRIEALNGIGNAESVSLSGGSLSILAVDDGIYGAASIDISGGILYAVTGGSAADGSFAIDKYPYTLSIDGLTILLPEGGTVEDIKTGVAEVLIAGSHTFGSSYVRNNTHHWLTCADEDCPFGTDDEIHQCFEDSNYAGHAADGICVCGYDATKEIALYVGGIGLAEGEYLSNSGQFSTAAPENEGYAHYSGGVLTLKDYEYSGAGHTFTVEEYYEYNAAVYSENALTVELTGTSTLTTNGIGIYSTGNITIQGSGTLNIDSDDDGVESESGDITVNGGTLSIVSAYYVGIDANNDGSITITGGTISIQAPDDEGIDADGEGVFTMTAGTLTIETGDDGIDCKGAINISGGTLTITAGNSGLESEGDTTITGGAITILSNTDGNEDDPYPALLMENGGKLTLGSNMSISKPAGGKVGTALDFAPDGESSVSYNTIVDADGAAATEVELKYVAPSDDDDGSSTPSAPSTPSSESITVPISGDEATIHVGATVRGDKATVKDVDLSRLDTVIGDHVNTGTVTIDFSGLDSIEPITTVEIPSDVVKQIAGAVSDPRNDAESLEIILSDGTSIEFDAVALGEKAAQADGLDITISIKNAKDAKLNQTQEAALKGRPAYDITVTSGGKHISDMGGKITVHAPYELQDGEHPRGIIVWYVDEDGRRERCETSYDPAKKRVNWKTDHLSLYMIDYDEALANNPFTDVSNDAYYFNAVLWAVDKGITNGTSATTFSPDASCTRAQMATFLWRAAGSPDPVGSTNPFTDVSADAYYAKAVQWAVEQGITVGTSATTFSPDADCTRAQMATFLWRNAGSPAPAGSTNPFTDVSADAYYAKAVQWAYEQEITGGTSATTFSPDADCTRAQMVTFLYRCFGK